MKPIDERFDAALAIADPVDRAHALNDLAFDAEQGAFDGRRAESIAIFERIAALDRDDDLLGAAIASAEEHLVLLGVRTLPPLETIVAELLDTASAIAPLTGKELRLHDEVRERARAARTP